MLVVKSVTGRLAKNITWLYLKRRRYNMKCYFNRSFAGNSNQIMMCNR